MRASSAATAFVCLAIVSIGCSAASGEAADETEEALTPASFSYVGQNVLAALGNSSADASWQHRTWNFTGDNTLDAGFVLQMPLGQYWGQSLASLPVVSDCDTTQAGCDRDFKLRLCATQADCTSGGICAPLAASVAHPGDRVKSMCIGHSDTRIDDVYGAIIQATRFVDLTTLTPQDGRFEAGIRNAITYLSTKATPPAVRMMYGNYPGAYVDTNTVLASVTRDVAKGSRIKVAIGAYRDGLESWNHSKIIAVDGKTALVGGMNLWTQHYLDKDPVHDLSMRLAGSAAEDAHLFANEIWKFVCSGGSGWWTGGSVQISDFGGGSSCPAAYVAGSGPRGTGSTKVISAGRLGAIGNHASDDAIVAMVGAARQTVYLAQQDLGPVQRAGVALDGWPDALLTEIARGLGRGVDVYLVLSNPNSVAGGLGSASGAYSNGWTIEDTASHIAQVAQAHPQFSPAGTDLNALLCQHLHVAPLRASADDTWPDGSMLTNHAKFVMVDGRTFFIGSQNAYVANLAEYGFIVDDQAAAQQVVSEYWARVWGSSSRVAVTGSEAASCMF